MILWYPTAVSLQHGYNNLQGCRTCPFLGTESIIHVKNSDKVNHLQPW
jgi:hypothetical protein